MNEPPATRPVPPADQLETRPPLVTVLAAVHTAVGLVLLPPGGWMLLFGVQEYQTLPAVLGALLLLLAGLSVACGIGLWRLRGWGRRLAVLFAALALPLFPIGTAPGLAVLLYLLRPGARVLFAGRAEADLPPAEREALAALRSLGWHQQLLPLPVQLVLLAAVLLVGVLAAFNLKAHFQRQRERTTRRAIRELANALEAYAMDHDRFPAHGSLDALAADLAPTYLPELPRLDAWGRELRVEVWRKAPEPGPPDTYAIGSAGRDGAVESTRLRDHQPRRYDDFDQDLVFANGTWVEVVYHPEDW